MRDIKPEVAQARLDRARTALGAKTPYLLGKGGFGNWKPGQPSDCSGFISWVIQTRRAPKPGRNFWIETTSIVNDAKGPQKVFTKVDPQPGCLCVYGDSDGHEGHIGLVTSFGRNLVMGKVFIKGIDCGHGNWVHHGDAILEHELTYFETNPHTLYVALRQDLQ